MIIPIWAMFKETDLKFKETDLRFKETERIIGKLGNRFGELAEHLVSPGIMDKFNELGFSFTEQSLDLRIKDPENPDAYTTKFYSSRMVSIQCSFLPFYTISYYSLLFSD